MEPTCQAALWDGEAWINLTESDIQKMRDAVIGDGEIGPREHRAKDFMDVLDQYLNFRRRVDPTFRNVPGTNACGCGDAEFDLYGDIIEIDWYEVGGCYGDPDNHRVQFPTAHLWSPDWDKAIKEDVEAKAVSKRASMEKQAEHYELLERKTLLILLNKYGIPEEYKP